MHIAFDMELDKALSSVLPSFDPYQKDYFINNAYLMKINQKLTGNNTLQQSFEVSPKRTSDLQKLVKHVVIKGSNTSLYAKNEMSFSLTGVSDFMYPVSSVFKYNENRYSPTITTNHDIINNFRWSDTNRPWITSPVITYENDEIKCYIDPDDVSDVAGDYPELVLTYIKRPVRLNFFSTSGPSYIPEIDEHVIPEIISLAVDLAIENIESPRIQTHTQITQNKE